MTVLDDVVLHAVQLARVRELATSGVARAVRLAAQLSQAELAALVATATGSPVDASVICRWERGERKPHGDAALAYGRIIAELSA